MYRNKSILGLIPARAGSKDLPEKNVKPFLGRPLIAYTIEQALASKYIDKVIVSTDSAKIADIAKKYGSQTPFLRPASLATDKAPMYKVAEHAVDFFNKKGERFDIVVVLQPTSPLRRVSDIDEAVVRLEKTKADSVVSICKMECPLSWMVFIDNAKVNALSYAKVPAIRQNAFKVYKFNGAVYAVKTNFLEKAHSFLGKNSRPLIMPQRYSVDIDTDLHFKMAELILGEELSKNAQK